MNRNELKAFIKNLQAEELEILMNKGAEYNTEDNVFDNFERAGETLGLSREDVLIVYLSKHIDSIYHLLSAIRNNDTAYLNSLSEAPLGRMIDARNYLGILAAMLSEKLPEAI